MKLRQMGLAMFFAPSNRRVIAGLFFAMPLVAIGPLVAVAQYGNVRNSPNRSPAATSPARSHINSAPLKREALFGDQGLNWKMPFTRGTTSAKPSQKSPQTVAGRPASRAGFQEPRIPTSPKRNSTLARVPMDQQQAVPNMKLPRPIAKSKVQTAAAPQRVAQRPNSMPAQRTMPTTAHATAMPTTPAARQVPQVSKNSPAVLLLAQAHEWSASAHTESDFTRIIDTCRQAGAERSNAEVGRYANELASWALNRRGQLKAEAGNEDEALSDFNAAIQADARRWRAVHNRGVLLASHGEFEKAFNDFTRTIALNSQFAKAYSNRAALYVVSGNLQSAIDDYTKSIELDPDLAVAHRGLGRACHLDGQLETALRHYEETVRLAPNDSYAIASRADVLIDLGRYAEAASEYDRAIEINPDSSQAHAGSAWLLATCPDDAVRNPELALERAQAAIDLTHGEDAASLDTLAAAQANSGDFAAASQSIEQAVQLATPGEKESYLERLALYQEQKPYRLEPAAEVVQASHQSQ